MCGPSRFRGATIAGNVCEFWSTVHPCLSNIRQLSPTQQHEKSVDPVHIGRETATQDLYESVPSSAGVPCCRRQKIITINDDGMPSEPREQKFRLRMGQNGHVSNYDDLSSYVRTLCASAWKRNCIEVVTQRGCFSAGPESRRDCISQGLNTHDLVPRTAEYQI